MDETQGDTGRPRVLVCGSRHWKDEDFIDGFVASLVPKGAVIIHGAARGADSMAGQSAERHGLECLAFPADWDRHGKRAGFLRNQQMLDEAGPTMVAAFTYDIYQSRGTCDMAKRALNAGLRVYINPVSSAILPQRLYKSKKGVLFIAQEVPTTHTEGNP